MNIIQFSESLNEKAGPLVCFTTHTRFFTQEGMLEAWTTKSRFHQSETLLYRGDSEQALFAAVLKYEQVVDKKCKCKKAISFIDHLTYLECAVCGGLAHEQMA